MKRTARILLLFVPILLSAAPAKAPDIVEIKVYVRQAPAAGTPQFSEPSKHFTFVVPESGSTFKKAEVEKFGQLRIPPSMREERAEQTVEVGMIVSPKGEVVAVTVISSTYKDFEEAAREMARGTKLKPATLDGKRVYTYCVLPVGYRYTDPEEIARILKGIKR